MITKLELSIAKTQEPFKQFSLLDDTPTTSSDHTDIIIRGGNLTEIEESTAIMYAHKDSLEPFEEKMIVKYFLYLSELRKISINEAVNWMYYHNEDVFNYCLKHSINHFKEKVKIEA